MKILHSPARADIGAHAPSRGQAPLGSLGLLALTTGLTLLASSARSQQGDGASVDDTRSALETYFEVRRTIAKERSDWALGKEMLEERCELLRREIAGYRERRADAGNTISETEVKASELRARIDELKTALATLEQRLPELEERTRRLVARLSDHHRSQLQSLIQRLPEDSSATELSVSQRYETIVGIHNQLNKFNRDIVSTSEVRTLGGGETAEVTALYVGIAAGFYVTTGQDAAGIGSAGVDAWRWTPANDSAAAIARALSIQEGSEAAAFVQVPISVE